MRSCSRIMWWALQELRKNVRTSNLGVESKQSTNDARLASSGAEPMNAKFTVGSATSASSSFDGNAPIRPRRRANKPGGSVRLFTGGSQDPSSTSLGFLFGSTPPDSQRSVISLEFAKSVKVCLLDTENLLIFAASCHLPMVLVLFAWDHHLMVSWQLVAVLAVHLLALCRSHFHIFNILVMPFWKTMVLSSKG